MCSNNKKLQEYARLLVEVGVNIQPGQTLVITCPVDQAPFARMCAKVGYDRGCKEVVVRWGDDALTRMKYLNAQPEVFDVVPEWTVRFTTDYAKEGAAFLNIISSDPENLSGVDPDRISRFNKAAAVALREYRTLAMNSAFPWSIGALASPSWARMVFPGLEEQAAIEALWDKIFDAVRVSGDGTAVDAWNAHTERLRVRMDKLNSYRFDRLHYYNGLGTDFAIGLAKGHIWQAGGEYTHKGQYFIPNMPTEEIFTAPDRNRAEGTICASMPLCIDGNVIKDICFTVQEGKIVSATASQGEDHLLRALDVDEGAKYFGEVALVPYDSPISNTKVLFYNTLFDENAACHFAFGEAYPTTVEGASEWDKDTCVKNGVNVSATHEDFMVGTADLSIDGYQADGTVVPVFRNGNFVF